MLRYFYNKFSGNANEKSSIQGLEVFTHTVPIVNADDASDGWVKIVPIGVFPVHHNGGHEVTADHINEMVRNFKKSGTDLLIDYEHRSLWGNTKAAGWINKIEAREDGLYAKYPEFTPAGQEFIENREFRYFSPVYVLESSDKKGKDRGARIHSVALTNTPYFDSEIDPIGNSRTADVGAAPQTGNLPVNDLPNETPIDMKLNKEALEALGLDENATEEEVNKAIVNSAKVEEPSGEAPEAEPETPKVNTEEIPAWGKELMSRLDQNDADTHDERVQALVNAAIEKGKIKPAEKAVYENAARQDYPGTKTLLDGLKANSAIPSKITPDASGEQPVSNSESFRSHILEKTPNLG